MRALALIMLLSVSALGKTLILSDDTTVVLRLPVTDESVVTVQKDLMTKAKAGKPLLMVLNSPGGSVVAGKALIETIKGLGVPVHTLSMFSASMSFIISQYADTRYVMGSSMLMTHRVHVEGMSGDLPGSLLSRVIGILAETNEVDTHIAERAKMNYSEYQGYTASELWMTGELALKMGFADEVVTARCDNSLSGNTKPVNINLGFLSLDVSFHKCPLIQGPASVKMAGTQENASAEYSEFLRSSFNHYYTYTQRKGYAR